MRKRRVCRCREREGEGEPERYMSQFTQVFSAVQVCKYHLDALGLTSSN